MAFAALAWRGLLVGVALLITLMVVDFAMSFLSPILSLLPLPAAIMSILIMVVYVILLGAVAVFVLKFIGIGLARLPTYDGFAIRMVRY